MENNRSRADLTAQPERKKAEKQNTENFETYTQRCRFDGDFFPFFFFLHFHRIFSPFRQFTAPSRDFLPSLSAFRRH